MYVYRYIHMCTCIDIHICVYRYTHMCIYICACIHYESMGSMGLVLFKKSFSLQDYFIYICPYLYNMYEFRWHYVAVSWCHTYMYLCVCLFVCVCVCACACVLQMYMCVYVHVCIYVYICINIYKCIHMYIYTFCKHVQICTCEYENIRTCINVYRYI